MLAVPVGSYWAPGAVLGAEAARAEAKKLLAKVALGEDPQADKVERRDKDRVSLKSMIDEYLLQKEAPRCVSALSSSFAEISHRGRTSKHCTGLAIDKITRKDVAGRTGGDHPREQLHCRSTGTRCSISFLCMGDAVRFGRSKSGDRHCQAAGHQTAREIVDRSVD